MITLLDLWLPILVAAVFVFLASSVIHMALPIHKADFGKLPGEDKVLEAMRAQSLKPGSYMFPCAASMKEMCTPEMVAKQNLGPVGHLTVMPNGPVKMGKHLLQWFVFCIVVGVFVAYVAHVTMTRGASSASVFRVTAVSAFLGYALTNATDSIWKGVSWSITMKFLFDGLVYALVTGAAFGWLWPGVA